MSFESAAPPTKNWGLSKICVTRWTSAGERFSLFCSARPYKHLFLSFSKSNSISLQSKNDEMLCSNEWSSYLNLLFFARQSLAIRCTLFLQYSIALSSSLVTSKPPCSFARGTAGKVVVSTVVTTVVVMVKRGLSCPFRDTRSLYLWHIGVISGCALWRLWILGASGFSEPRMY